MNVAYLSALPALAGSAVGGFANCHGPDGIGEAYATPYLAGQGSAYLRSAIGEWKSGARKNDGGQQMAVVAARLDDRDISAISAYFESSLPHLCAACSEEQMSAC